MGKKRKQLAATVRAIQMRWGAKALQRGETMRQPALAVPHLSTSFPALDEALGIGGIPQGRITEMLGGFTSGVSTLALKVMANAQQGGQLAAYVDIGATFDPDYAARCGVHLARLLLVRPATAAEALEITHSLITGRSVALVIFDDVSQLVAAAPHSHIFGKALRQLPAGLSQTQSSLIFLTLLHGKSAMSAANYPAGFALPHYTTLRLQLTKERWLYHYRDIRGYQARVVVLKNKLGQAGQQVNIAITFNGTVRGDAT